MEKIKVLLLLADGMRPDFMMNCDSPYVIPLLEESAYTLQGRSVMPSVTLPCHMSLFHSVPPERHGILSNTYAPQVRPVNGLIEQLRSAGKKCGFVYDWEQLRDLSLPGSLSYSFFLRGADSSNVESAARMTDTVIGLFREDALDFIFLYIGLPDETGHAHGFTSEPYRAAVRAVWEHIHAIRQALPTHYNMIVTADHGGHERSHGTDSAEDMTIPIILRGPCFRAGDPERLRGASILDIAPTIANILGAQADPAWEGKPLL